MTDDTNYTDEPEVEEKRNPQSGPTVKVLLEGSLLAEKVRRNIRYVLFVSLLGIWYISMVYATEKLHRERQALENEVRDLRFESISEAAELMLMRKQSEVIKRIKEEKLTLEESKEPPVKLYRR